MDRSEARLDLSVVVPMFNEAGNLTLLVESIERALTGFGRSFEVLIVDDGSTDGSAEELDVAAASRPWLHPIRLIRNYGQSAALQAGFDHAAGRLVVTLDADLQNDPADIPRIVRILEEDDSVDVVAGWRRRRQDSTLRRILPSRIANGLISRVTGVKLHDYGCTLKAYRREILDNLRLYGEQHRFIPALAAEAGARIVEVEVEHRPRLRGTSKYGIGRTGRVILDLFWIAFLLRFLHRPIHAFGGAGLALAAVGLAILGWLTIEKLVLGEDIGGRPLLLFGLLLTLVGVQLLATGVIGELLIRIYHEPQGRRQYVVRPRTRERAPASSQAPQASRGD